MPFRFRSLTSDRPIMVFDLETTGTRPGIDRIVQIALLQVWTDGTVNTFDTLINPGCPIPPEATAVHGIADHHVADAYDFAAYAPSMAPTFVGHDLVGFGIRRFDLPLLVAEFERAGIHLDLTGARVFDVKDIYHSLHPRTLSSAVRTYCEREHEQAHNAVGDVLATAEVLDALLARHPELPSDAVGLDARFRNGDIAGRFLLVDGQPTFRSGKHEGRQLLDVARNDPGYLHWLLREPLLSDARDMVFRALSDAQWSFHTAGFDR